MVAGFVLHHFRHLRIMATMPTFLFGMTAVRRRRMVQRITVQSTTFR